MARVKVQGINEDMASQAQCNAGVFLSGNCPESSSEKWVLPTSSDIHSRTKCRCFPARLLVRQCSGLVVGVMECGILGRQDVGRSRSGKVKIREDGTG